MKIHSKTKKPIKKVKNLTKTATKSVFLIHAKHPLLRHFKLIGHKHTGKTIHHKHTSHVLLMTILVFVGFFLFISNNLASAQTLSGTVSVGVIVPGPPPSIGAVITSPMDGLELIDKNKVEVSGTCPKETFITISVNNKLAGSTICTDDGIFSLDIELHAGKNTISALDYDYLNQAGPATPSVTINVKTSVTIADTDDSQAIIYPTLPVNPSIEPEKNSDDECNSYEMGILPKDSTPHISVVCFPRIFEENTNQTLGVLVWGGAPPYALNIKWSADSEDTLLSLSKEGYNKVKFSYASAGIYKIILKIKDSNDNLAIVQTAVQVYGEAKTPIASITDDILHKSWFETPVPLYIMAVALTLGFWGGDIFNRKFGYDKKRRNIQSST